MYAVFVLDSFAEFSVAFLNNWLGAPRWLPKITLDFGTLHHNDLFLSFNIFLSLELIFSTFLLVIFGIEPSSQNREGYAMLDTFVGTYKCPPEQRYIPSMILLYITTNYLRNCWQYCSIIRLESATQQRTFQASLFQTVLQTFFLPYSNFLVPLVLVRTRISLTLHVC